MVEFQETQGLLILAYSSERGDNGWVYRKIKEKGVAKVRGTFHVEKRDLFGASTAPSPKPHDPIEIKIGVRKGDYYRLDRRILRIDFDLWIHKDIDLDGRSFTSVKNVSIFAVVNKLAPGEIRIGGNRPGSISQKEFRRLIKAFPSTYELERYVGGRVSAVLRDFLEIKRDGQKQYHQYMNKKLGSGREDNLLDALKGNEIAKYKALHKRLTEMLQEEDSYTEAQWQSQILQIILLLYPKYIRVFKAVPVRDTYNGKTRQLDFLLVDSTGNVDIVEIKKPFEQAIVSTTVYRDNHIPLRELSGTVMQIEKYIFYLNKWGRIGEKVLTEKYKHQLPAKFKIQITNPSGIILMGRDVNLKPAQKQDFEVIKRKYKNVVDIITYDDLVGRLRFTIEQLENRAMAG